jgi:hypothetical protein
MKISEIITEVTISWKFKKSTLTEDEFSRSYQLRWRREKSENDQLKFRPAPLLSGYLESVRTNTLKESRTTEVLIKYQRRLVELDMRSAIDLKPGSEMGVLQFLPHTSSNVIEIRGHVAPKEIVDVNYDESGDVDWIEFSDGSTFPDREFLSHNKGGGEWDGITTLFFPDRSSAESILNQALLMSPDGWTTSSVNITESVIAEASGYIPSEAERNDPRFSTALTVDIKPDTMKRNAKKLGWRIARDGRPPLLRP